MQGWSFPEHEAHSRIMSIYLNSARPDQGHGVRIITIAQDAAAIRLRMSWRVNEVCERN